MPGKLLSLSRTHVTGWAAHPRHPEYRVLVNVVHRTVVVRSTIAEQELTREETGGPATQCGFRFDLSKLGVPPEEIATLRFQIGETDEWLDSPERRVRPRGAQLSVEELLASAHSPRRWVRGLTYIDAGRAGLRVETIVDLLYRDYLGRPSDPNGLAHYSSAVRSGANTFDDIRRAFIDADEYRNRRKPVERAPGSIFSQHLVMAVAPFEPERDPDQAEEPEPKGRLVAAEEFVHLEGRDFVAEAHRRLLLRDATDIEMSRGMTRLASDDGKLAMLKELAEDLEAITLGVRLIGLEAHAP